jgi:methionyl-tRNA formyltransferase
MPSPVKRAAVEAGIPVVEPPSLREEASVQALLGWRPDLVVVAAFAYLLPPAVLSVPGHGCLNVHPSLLPLYRGPSPVATALLNGDTETGVSIMLMDTGLDTGPVLSQERVAITDDDTTGSLTMLLAELGARLLLTTIDGWLEGRVDPRPQQENQATFSARITAGEGRLNWFLPATVLGRQVRAYHPWPGSHTVWKGQRLKVRSAVALTMQQPQPPGTVIELPKPFSIGVATGEGVLALRSIQLEGKREVAAEEFVRGHRDFPGAHLDS